jgi:hypothetical protein
MLAAGLENLWYVDTDSLRGAASIAKRLAPYLAPSRLGGLKIEERHSWCDIRGCKDYETPRHLRMKGVRGNAQSNDGVAYAQEQWQGWAGAIASGRLDLPVTREIVKVLYRNYTKGDVLPTGRVAPLHLALP